MADQTFVCCGKCRGLFAQKDLSTHKKKCDGSADSSKAVLFACERSLYLDIQDPDQNVKRDTVASPSKHKDRSSNKHGKTATNVFEKSVVANFGIHDIESDLDDAADSTYDRSPVRLANKVKPSTVNTPSSRRSSRLDVKRKVWEAETGKPFSIIKHAIDRSSKLADDILGVKEETKSVIDVKPSPDELEAALEKSEMTLRQKGLDRKRKHRDKTGEHKELTRVGKKSKESVQDLMYLGINMQPVIVIKPYVPDENITNKLMSKNVTKEETDAMTASQENKKPSSVDSGNINDISQIPNAEIVDDTTLPQKSVCMPALNEALESGRSKMNLTAASKNVPEVKHKSVVNSVGVQKTHLNETLDSFDQTFTPINIKADGASEKEMKIVPSSSQNNDTVNVAKDVGHDTEGKSDTGKLITEQLDPCILEPMAWEETAGGDTDDELDSLRKQVSPIPYTGSTNKTTETKGRISNRISKWTTEDESEEARNVVEKLMMLAKTPLSLAKSMARVRRTQKPLSVQDVIQGKAPDKPLYVELQEAGALRYSDDDTNAHMSELDPETGLLYNMQNGEAVEIGAGDACKPTDINKSGRRTKEISSDLVPKRGRPRKKPLDPTKVVKAVVGAPYGDDHVSQRKKWINKKEDLAEKYAAYVVEEKEKPQSATVNGLNQTTKLEPSKKYKCPYCEWTTSMVGHFDRHMKSRHPHGAEIQCSVCSFHTTKIAAFRRHMDTHTKAYQCEMCGQGCSTKRDLVRHINGHTGEKPFVCELCGYKTRFRECLYTHKKKHDIGKKYYCDQPGCKFVSIYGQALVTHRDSVHGLGPTLSCDECNFTTKSHTTFRLHQKAHRGEKNFQCSFCGFRALTKYEVVKHIRRHTKEKVYFCDQCSFSSSHPTPFKVHMMQHRGVKPFQCPKCGYNSTTKQKVVRHIQARHPTERQPSVLHVGVNLKINLSDYRRRPEVKHKVQKITVSEGRTIEFETVAADGVFEHAEAAQQVEEDTLKESDIEEVPIEDNVVAIKMEEAPLKLEESRSLLRETLEDTEINYEETETPASVAISETENQVIYMENVVSSEAPEMGYNEQTIMTAEHPTQEIQIYPHTPDMVALGEGEELHVVSEETLQEMGSEAGMILIQQVNADGLTETKAIPISGRALVEKFSPGGSTMFSVEDLQSFLSTSSSIDLETAVVKAHVE